MEVLLHNKFFTNGNKILLQSTNDKILSCIFTHLLLLVFKNESVFKILNEKSNTQKYILNYILEI